MDISKKSLSGPLPTKFGAPNLDTIILYFNYFSGQVPTSTCELSLWGLDLANNLFEGEFPQCLNMTQMAYLLLGNNSSSRESVHWNSTRVDWELQFITVLMTESQHVPWRFVILVLYVDDILLASNDKNMLHEAKNFLSSHFDMKDLGDASYVLGIEINRDRTKGVLGLSQKAYIEKMLARYNMQKCAATPVPFAKGDKFGE